MKKAVITLSLSIAALFFIFFGYLIAINISPYLYTKIYGDEGTEKLYLAYRMARSKPDLDHLRVYIENNDMEYIEYRDDNIITLHNDSPTNSETVIIWHETGKITNARFESFP